MSSAKAFCFCDFWEVEEKEEVPQKQGVSANCGHQFHDYCLDRWIDLNKAVVAPDDIRCPMCGEKLSTRSSEQLELEYVGLSESEKAEVEWKIGSAEIKILLGITYDQLEGKIALSNPKWMDLAPAFRDELVDKLSDKIAPDAPEHSPLPRLLKSKALTEILTSSGSGDSELVRLVINEYIEEISKRNGGKLSWEHMGKSFQEEVLQKLRNSSGLEMLELTQVPLTPTTFKLLLTDGDDKKLLAIMTSSYLADVVDGMNTMESLCELLLDEMILESGCASIDGSKEFRVGATLFKIGILKLKNEDYFGSDSKYVDLEGSQFGFCHDSVKHLFLGMIEGWVMEPLKCGEETILIKMQDTFSIYFRNYFVETVRAGRTQVEVISETFNKVRNKIIDGDLLMACVFTNSRNVTILEAAVAHYERCINKNLLYASLRYCIEGRLCDLSFLHLAALSGNLAAVKVLSRFLKRNPTFKYDVLTNLMLKNTGSCDADVIGKKKDVILELLNHNKNLFDKRYNPVTGKRRHLCPVPPLVVHDIHVELIKFSLEKGANIYTRDEVKETVLHKAASYMTPEQFHDLVSFVNKKGFWDVLPFKNDCEDTALHIARSKMQVKPETEKLFLAAKKKKSRALFVHRGITFRDSTDESD